MFKNLLNKWYYLGAFYSLEVAAKLPTAKESQGASSGDYVEMGRETTSDGVAFLVQIIGAFLLICVVGALGKTYWEVTKNNKEWSDFISVGVGGAVTAVIGMIMLTMAEAIFS